MCKRVRRLFCCFPCTAVAHWAETRVPDKEVELSKIGHLFKSNIYVIVSHSMALDLTATFQLSVLLWACSLSLSLSLVFFGSSVSF